MKRRILSIITALALCLCLLPVPALAAGEISVSSLDELKAAINQASNGTDVTAQMDQDITGA